MKLLLFLALIFALAACSGRQDDDIFIWDENIENPFYGETLTIAISHGRALVERMNLFARLYMRENPGVNIEVVVFDADWDIAQEQLRIQLLAGQAPVLMDANIVNTRNRDFFVDWIPLIEAHPGFNNDEWFMNAFYALAEDGRLYEFPEDISYFYVASNLNVPGLSSVLEPIETISIEEMLAIYMDFGGAGSGLNMKTSDSISPLTLWFSQDFFDLDSGFVNFLSPQFIELLEKTMDIMKPFPDSVMNELMQGRIWQQLMAEYFMFNLDLAPGVFSSGLLEDSTFGNQMLFTNNYGELYVLPFVYSWALNSATTSKQQALALDFIIFSQDSTLEAALTHRVIYMGRIPLNRARFEHEIRTKLDATIATYERNMRLRKSRYEARNYLIDRINYAMNRPMTRLPSVPLPIVTFFNETLESLNLGLITPHEAATALQNRVVLEILEGN